MPSPASTNRIHRKPLPQSPQANDPSSARLLPDVEKGVTKKVGRNHCATAYTRYFEEWWLWELLSAILGLLAMVAMYWLLSQHNDRRLPQWGSVFGAEINLNAVLSLLGLVIKSSLMLAVLECISQLKWTWYSKTYRSLEDLHVFDNASRGPIGAIWILFKVPRAHLAFVGALLSLLSLALDPFIQQTVQYKSIRVENATSNALLQTVQDWKDDVRETSSMPPTYDPSFSIVSTATSAFFAYGKSPDAKLSDVAPTCPTGNCTWPAEVSLAVCATSANVTSSLKLTEPNEEGAFNVSLPFQGLELTTGGRDFDSVFTMFTDSFPSVPKARDQFTPDYRINGSNSIAMPETLNPLMHGWIIWQAGWPTDEGGFEGKQDAHAIEFALEWCGQTLNTAVTNGNPSISLSAPDLQISYSRFETAGDPYDEGTILSAQPLQSIGNVFSPTLTVNAQSHFALANWLQTLKGSVQLNYFHGVITESSGDSQSGSAASSSDANIPLSVYDMLKNTSSDPFLGGFKPMLDNLATSVTNRIRSLAGTPRQGTSYSYETHVRVRWAWLALPCCFTLFSLLFFIATVLHQQFSKTFVWKSHSSAILYALDPESKKIQGTLGRSSEMDDRTKSVLARLEHEPGKGWRLVTKEKAAPNNGQTSQITSSASRARPVWTNTASGPGRASMAATSPGAINPARTSLVGVSSVGASPVQTNPPRTSPGVGPAAVQQPQRTTR